MIALGWSSGARITTTATMLRSELEVIMGSGAPTPASHPRAAMVAELITKTFFLKLYLLNYSQIIVPIVLVMVRQSFIEPNSSLAKPSKSLLSLAGSLVD